MSYHHDSERTGLYRSRSGIIFGVCKGIANHLDISRFWLRAGAVLALLLTGIYPVVILYILAALLMKPEPILPIENEAEEEFYNSYVSSRGMALARLKRTYDSLDRRIQRIENIVTAPDYDWERRLYSE
jgi:phage shock protein C